MWNVGTALSQSVGLNNATPDVSSILDLTATEFLQWDSEELNTNTAYFGYVSGRNYIEIFVAGYYSISVSILKWGVALDEATRLDLRRFNSLDSQVEIIHSLYTEGAGSSYAHLSGTVVEYFDANDRLKVYDVDGGSGVLGNATYNILSVYKIN